MASGPEVLLKSIFKALGLNPQEFVQGIETFMTGINDTLQKFDVKIASNEAKLDRILSLLEERNHYGARPIKLIPIDLTERTNADDTGTGG